jgi:uncharacterized protein YjbI with pentapeptide repeats
MTKSFMKKSLDGKYILRNADITENLIYNNIMLGNTIGSSQFDSITVSNSQITMSTLSNILLTQDTISNSMLINNSFSNLSGNNISSSNIFATNATIVNIVLTQDTISNCILIGNSISNSVITMSTLSNSLLTGNSMNNTRITNTTMSNSRISAVNLTSSTLSNCIINNGFFPNTIANNILVGNTMNSSLLTNSTVSNNLIIGCTIGNSTTSNTFINETFPESSRFALIYNNAYNPTSGSFRQPLNTVGSANILLGNLYYKTGNSFTIFSTSGTLKNTSNRLIEGILVGQVNCFTSNGAGNSAELEVLVNDATSVFGKLSSIVKPANSSTVSNVISSYIALQPGDTLSLKYTLIGNTFIDASCGSYFTYSAFVFTNPFASFVTQF